MLFSFFCPSVSLCASLSVSLSFPMSIFSWHLYFCLSSRSESLYLLSPKCILTGLFFFFCLFPKGILNLFQTCPHEYRPARHLFTGHGGIEFQDLHFAVWARARRRVVGFLCLPNRACQSTPGDKDIGGAPAELWKSSIYVHRLIAQPRTSTCLRLHVKNIVCVCACVCVRVCDGGKERKETQKEKCVRRICLTNACDQGGKGAKSTKEQFLYVCVCVCACVCVSLPCRFDRRGWKHLFHKQTGCHHFAAGGLWWNCDTRPAGSREREKKESPWWHLCLLITDTLTHWKPHVVL